MFLVIIQQNINLTFYVDTFWGFIVSIHIIVGKRGLLKWFKLKCAGSMLTRRHVLTAAHCTINWENKTKVSELVPEDWLLPEDFLIGSNTPMQEVSSIGQRLHDVVAYHVHQEYVRTYIPVKIFLHSLSEVLHAFECRNHCQND